MNHDFEFRQLLRALRQGIISESTCPEEAVKPICELAGLIKEDLESQAALRPFAEDELSRLEWLRETSAALNAPNHRPGAAS